MKTICPRCNFKFKGNDIMCPSCHYNTMFIPCNVCGNMVATTAERCLKCGNPVPKKSTANIFIDIIGVIIIFYAVIMSMVGKGYYISSFFPMLILLILTWYRYEKFKKNPLYDCSKAKNTMIATAVMFVLLFFGLGIVII